MNEEIDKEGDWMEAYEPAITSEGSASLSNELLACPCGKVPNKLYIQNEHVSGKWAYVSADGCCGEWEIEYRNNYKSGDEAYALAVEAWNGAPRAS